MIQIIVKKGYINEILCDSKEESKIEIRVLDFDNPSDELERPEYKPKLVEKNQQEMDTFISELENRDL
jgi:hypothetical protein